MIVDAHLDLAYNALAFNRDLTKTVAQLRREEAGRKVGDGRITATIPSLRDSGVGLIFGTLYVAPFDKRRPDKEITYRDAGEAHQHALRQLDYYHRLADQIGYVRLVGDAATLQEIVHSHEEEGETPLLGVVPLLEGADPIREPDELEMWVERGLRAIGLAWDDTRYAGGAWRNQEGITPAGFALLEAMAEFNLILDLTHMSEKATFEALERYEGRVVATHCNARQLIPMDRHLSDVQIRRLAERGGVIGVVLYNRFLKPGYTLTDPKETVTLAEVTAQIDHICQVLGTAAHVGIGSDFDGGFGAEHIPAELDSVHDLNKIGDSLRERGYEPADIEGIMGGNWLRFLQETWA